MAVNTISLSGVADTFSVTLGGTAYIFRLFYTDNAEGGWALDISTQDALPILCGIPLLPGQDLLEPYAYLAIGGAGGRLIVSRQGSSEPPGFADLATTHLIFIDGAQ